MSKWQPIETAPKDGTVIILADDTSGLVMAGYFFDSGDGFPWVTLDNECLPPLNGWTDDGSGPTHWTPLPEPPK